MLLGHAPVSSLPASSSDIICGVGLPDGSISLEVIAPVAVIAVNTGVGVTVATSGVGVTVATSAVALAVKRMIKLTISLQKILVLVSYRYMQYICRIVNWVLVKR